MNEQNVSTVKKKKRKRTQPAYGSVIADWKSEMWVLAGH